MSKYREWKDAGSEHPQPSISIIIVVLNGAKTIRRAIESVVCQTYDNTHLMIVDGGSTDGTLKIVETYKDRIAYFRSAKDNGIYDAMNHALDHCASDWCLFLGCDDVLIDCLHLVAPRLLEQDTVYYGDVIRRSLGDIYSGRFSKFKLTFRNICHQAIFYPKSLFHARYNEKYRLLADYDLNIRLMGAGVSFSYLNLVVADYNNLGAASTGDGVFSADKVSILLSQFGLSHATLWHLREGLASIYRKLKR